MIANLTPRAGQTVSQSGDATFIVKNEFGVKTQHEGGGIHAYVSPQGHDMCPDKSAYYQIGSKINAIVFNANWIQILGKAEVPSDIKARQVAMFAHVIPFWQDYGQQMQRAREAEEAARPSPQLALQNTPHGSPAASLERFLLRGTPTVRGPDGLATQLVPATGSEPATTESFAIHTPRSSPNPELTNRSKMSMPWRRSASCSTRRKRSTTPGTTDVVANTEQFRHRIAFGGNEQRPGPDVPQLLLDSVPG